jgi:hypothetical protein
MQSSFQTNPASQPTESPRCAGLRPLGWLTRPGIPTTY